jgi:translation initiation factor IF-1
MGKQIISEEFKRMQKLAGIITESQLDEVKMKEGDKVAVIGYGPGTIVDVFDGQNQYGVRLSTGKTVFVPFSQVQSMKAKSSDVDEATLMSKGKSEGVEKPIVVGDLVAWDLVDYSNDRGMGGSYAGTAVGKVVKILGSRNMAVEVIAPSDMAGDTYKVDKQESKRVPQKGENIIASYSYNYGAGSGSQGQTGIRGIVTSINPEKATFRVKQEDGKTTEVSLRDLKILKVVS